MATDKSENQETGQVENQLQADQYSTVDAPAQDIQLSSDANDNLTTQYQNTPPKKRHTVRRVVLSLIGLVLLGGLSYSGYLYQHENSLATKYQNQVKQFVESKDMQAIKASLQNITDTNNGVLEKTYACQLTANEVWAPVDPNNPYSSGYSTQLNVALAGLIDPTKLASPARPGEYHGGALANILPAAKNAKQKKQAIDNFFTKLDSMNSGEEYKYCGTIYTVFEEYSYVKTYSTDVGVNAASRATLTSQLEKGYQDFNFIQDGTAPHTMNAIKDSAYATASRITDDVNTLLAAVNSGSSRAGLSTRFVADKTAIDQQVFSPMATIGKAISPKPVDVLAAFNNL